MERQVYTFFEALSSAGGFSNVVNLAFITLAGFFRKKLYLFSLLNRVFYFSCTNRDGDEDERKLSKKKTVVNFKD